MGSRFHRQPNVAFALRGSRQDEYSDRLWTLLHEYPGSQYLQFFGSSVWTVFRNSSAASIRSTFHNTCIGYEYRPTVSNSSNHRPDHHRLGGIRTSVGKSESFDRFSDSL